MKHKKLIILLGFFLALVVAPIVSWQIAYPIGTIRYRITVTVDTPSGPIKGSAVREVRVIDTPTFGLDTVTPDMHMRGEAAVVDLGQRGLLFAWLCSVSM